MPLLLLPTAPSPVNSLPSTSFVCYFILCFKIYVSFMHIYIYTSYLYTFVICYKLKFMFRLFIYIIKQNFFFYYKSNNYIYYYSCIIFIFGLKISKLLRLSVLNLLIFLCEGNVYSLYRYCYFVE